MKWLKLIRRCGRDKLVEPLRHLDFDFLRLFLGRYLTAYKLEPGEEVEANSNFFTLDAVYHLHFKYKKLGRTEMHNLLRTIEFGCFDLNKPIDPRFTKGLLIAAGNVK